MARIQHGSVLSGRLAKYGVSLAREAKLFYVDPLSTSFTLQDAIDACVADRGDVIVVEAGSHNVTESVNFDCQGITVIAMANGMAEPAGGEKFTVNAAAAYTNGPAATITAPCRIIGLGFAGRQLAGESLLIDSGGSGGFSAGFVSLEHCRFSAWYGAITAGIRMQGGQLNHVLGCTFDGLFGGFGTAGIILEDSGAINPGFTRIVGNYFSGLGSGKHAVSIDSSSTAVDLLIAQNHLLGGFSGDVGKLLDANSTSNTTGMVTRNHLGDFADKAAANSNIAGISGLVFAGNYYAE